MGKSGVVAVLLLLTGVGLAIGQEIPNPLPEKNPHAWADADKLYPSANQATNPGDIRQ